MRTRRVDRWTFGKCGSMCLATRVRHLHWKATARTGQLMIRDYADPQQPQFTVLLDNRQVIPAAPEFEEAVEVAASLVVAGGESGQPVPTGHFRRA
ncbi:DUF58 domain-containing protein [Kibdelosporangium philippinense]|uniref:DUF58 domain-containing protein n=1 Tax=Kibdelosporangium philippinense TaxID=211113 RepID=UPI0036076B85